MRLIQWLGSIRQDLRFAVRQLAKSPAFTAVAVLTMALGIGANSAIFSVVYSVLLRPLPYANAERLLDLRERNGATDRYGMFVTFGNYGAWLQRSREFEALGAYDAPSYTLTGAGDPQILRATNASAGYWKALYIPPTLGRYFGPDEDRPGAPRVVVLSHALWRSTFAGDSQAIGRTIALNGNPYTVIGVAAPEYALTPQAAALWVPLALSASDLAEHADHELTVVGLVRRGVPSAQAVAELTRIETALAREYPNSYFDGAIIATPEGDAVVGPARPVLLLMMSAVGLVLLIACVNVANLLLARAAARRPEFAIRSALGASRGRIVAQLLAESVVLATSGAVLGLGVAAVAIDLLVASASPSVPRLHDAALNGPVLAFTLVLAVASGVAFGFVPAVRASNVDLQSALRDGARGSGGPIRDRLRAVLVVAEVSVALVLLVGAGLFLRSAILLNRVSPGFDTRDLLVAKLSLPRTRYASDTAVALAFGEIARAVAAQPGVASASLVTRIPIGSGGADGAVCPEGSVQGDARATTANTRFATPGYFVTLRMPLVRGRAFSTADDAGAPRVAIVNAGLAHQLFGGADPIGRRLGSCGSVFGGAAETWEVVGVVGDMRANGLKAGPPNEVFFPSAQHVERDMWLVVRGAVPVARLEGPIRRAVKAIDAELPLAGVSTMDEIVAKSTAVERYTSTLLALLGVTGLVLAAIGIYGVIAYFVAQRTHEIGVRMALGASAGRVIGLAVRQGVVLALVGVAIGSGVSLLLSRSVAGLLYGVTPHDPFTFIAVGGLLLGVAMLASFVPALSVTRLDPLAALRTS